MLGLHQSRDGCGGFPHLCLAFRSSLGDGLGHAVTEMIFEQPECDRLERPGDRRDLSQDINAVDVIIDHPLQTANLSLDPAKALQVGVFVLAVTVHASPYLALTSRRPDQSARPGQPPIRPASA